MPKLGGVDVELHSASIWERLQARVASSAAQARRQPTRRRADLQTESLPGGGRVQILFQRCGAAALRLSSVDLPPGAELTLPLRKGLQATAWVMAGTASLAGHSCEAFDGHAVEPGAAGLAVASDVGARVLVREALAASAALAGPLAASDWQTLAEGVSRRLLGPASAGHGAFLVRLDPGASVPGHHHHRDEECLVIEGEMFLDDVLLLGGDFQLAPAGGVHLGVSSDRGALLYVHGDLDLDPLEVG
jgi:quercetin dioxygenase-like cupin family protein